MARKGKPAKAKEKRPAGAALRVVSAGEPKAKGPAKDRNRKEAARKPRTTMPVHALADERIHLALKQPGRLRQGYLKTLCGLHAVSALSPFAVASRSAERCKTCFGKMDKEGRVLA
jgi:hypothetical protein